MQIWNDCSQEGIWTSWQHCHGKQVLLNSENSWTNLLYCITLRSSRNNLNTIDTNISSTCYFRAHKEVCFLQVYPSSLAFRICHARQFHPSAVKCQWHTKHCKNAILGKQLSHCSSASYFFMTRSGSVNTANSFLYQYHDKQFLGPSASNLS